MLTDHDIYLFREGSHSRLYEKLGCTLVEGEGADFAVWAPNAQSVSVIGDFNGWNPTSHALKVRADESGIWEGRVPHVRQGQAYKYRIVSSVGGYTVEKAEIGRASCRERV